MPRPLPRVSVVVPLYNVEAYVQEAIDSVVAQSLEEWELVVTDDGSTDASAEIVRRAAAADSRIRLYRQENSGGPAAPRNRSIESSSGEYVCFLDPDDLLHPRRLEIQAGLLERFEDVDVVFSDMTIFSQGVPQEGRPYLRTLNWRRRAEPFMEAVSDGVYRCGSRFYRFMSTEFTSLTTQTVMVRRRALDRCDGPFDERLHLGEDVDLWFRLATDCRLLYVDETLAYYRRHSGSIMADKERELRSFLIAHSRNLKRAEARLDADALHLIRHRLAQTSFSLGYYYVTQGRFPEGRERYREALASLPVGQVARAWGKAWLRQLLAMVRH